MTDLHNLPEKNKSFHYLKVMLADLYGSVFSHNLKPTGESCYCISELIFCQHRRQIIFMLIDVN